MTTHVPWVAIDPFKVANTYKERGEKYADGNSICTGIPGFPRAPGQLPTTICNILIKCGRIIRASEYNC